MSFTEIKRTVDAMDDDDRLLATAYLQHLANDRDAAYLGTLNERMEAMDAGKKISWDRVLHMHETLAKEGM